MTTVGSVIPEHKGTHTLDLLTYAVLTPHSGKLYNHMMLMDNVRSLFDICPAFLLSGILEMNAMHVWQGVMEKSKKKNGGGGEETPPPPQQLCDVLRGKTVA